MPFGACNNHVVITLFRVIENFLRDIPLEMLNRYLYSYTLSGRYRFVHQSLIFPSQFFQSLLPFPEWHHVDHDMGSGSAEGDVSISTPSNERALNGEVQSAGAGVGVVVGSGSC